MLSEPRLSRYGAASTRPSPVNRMMAAFANDFRDGIDCNLGVGYVNEATIPTPALKEAMEAVAANPARYRQAFNYGGPEGSSNLMASLRRFLAGRGALDERTLESNRLVIGACGATSILEAFADVLAPGIVVTSDPLYYIYGEALERKGFDVLAVPEDEHGIDCELLTRKLDELGGGIERVSFIYVVTVNNPSCTILSNARRRELYQVAANLSVRLGRRVPVLFDLAYELLLHDPAAEAFQSVLPHDQLGIAYEVGTLSKVLAPALRIGYLLGPDGPLMNAVVQKTSDTGFSAPLFVQEMASWLLDNRIETQLRTVNEGYRSKATTVGKAIASYLGDLLEGCTGGQAGFYFYLTFRDTFTGPDSSLFRALTRTTGDSAWDDTTAPRVIYIPGVYCVQPGGQLAEVGLRQLRISYGFEPVERIVQSIRLIRAAIDYGSNHPSDASDMGHKAISQLTSTRNQ